MNALFGNQNTASPFTTARLQSTEIYFSLHLVRAGRPGERVLDSGAHGPGLARFLVVWVGQSLSQIGSGIVTFALGVWLFKTNNSPVQFGLVALAASISAVAVPLLSGALIDRWPRRSVMLAADACGALMAGAMLAAYLTHMLSLALLLPLVLIATACAAIHFLAYSASVSILVSKDQFVRVNGLMQLSTAASMLLGPVLGSILFLRFSLSAVLALNIASYAIGFATLLLVRFPGTASSATPRGSVDLQVILKALRESMARGLTFHTQRQSLFWLLALFVVTNFAVAATSVLLIPIVLAQHQAAALTFVAGASGFGMMTGALTASLVKFRNQVRSIVIAAVWMGGALIVVGLVDQVIVRAAAVFAFSYLLAVNGAAGQAVWQRKVQPNLQATVFGFRRAVAMCGLLVGNLFLPLAAVAVSSGLAAAGLLPLRPDLGLQVVFAITGLTLIAMALVVVLRGQVLNLETRVPDWREPEAT